MAMNEGFVTSLAGDEDLAALRRRLLEDEAAEAAARAGGVLPLAPPGGGLAQPVVMQARAVPAASAPDAWKSGGLPEVPRGAVQAGLGGAGAGAGLVGAAASAVSPWGDLPREARPNQESAIDAAAWREAERQRVDAEMKRGYQRWVEDESRPAAPPEIRTLEWRYDREGLMPPPQIQRLESSFDGDGVGPLAEPPLLQEAEASAPVPRVLPPPAQPVRSEPEAGGLSGTGMSGPSALRDGAAPSVWGNAGAGAGWQPQAATPGSAGKSGDGDDEHTSGYAEGRPSAAAAGRPALWQGLTTLGEEGEVVDRFMNGDWLVRTGPQRQERVFRDAQVAAMTGMHRGGLDSFIEQHGLARDDAPVALPEPAAGASPPGGGPTLAQVYEGEPQGLQRVTGRALASLRRQLTPGLLGRVQVHATLADWLATPAGQRWTPQQVQAMQGAEGFYDPASGTRVILAGGISPHRGESPRAAVERVVRHTAVTPDLLDRLLGTGQRAVQYDNLTKLIRPEHLQELQARNPALLQHPRLAGLDFVGYIQHQRPDIALNERSVPSRLVQTLGLAEEEAAAEHGQPSSPWQGLAQTSAPVPVGQPAGARSAPHLAGKQTPEQFRQAVAAQQEADDKPRLEWRQMPVYGKEVPDEVLAVRGKWKVEDLVTFLQNPLLASATPAQRMQALDEVLEQAGSAFLKQPGLTQTDLRNYQELGREMRKQIEARTDWLDKAKSGADMVEDSGVGLARTAVAGAVDSTFIKPEADFLGEDESMFRMPFSTVGGQVVPWFEKLGDSTSRVLAWSADEELESTLAELRKDMEEGNIPVGDRAAFDAWLGRYGERLSGAQARWYKGVQGADKKITLNGKEETMDEDWLQSYALVNGLEAPQNMALVAGYLRTQNPALLDQLRENLKRTPQREDIDRRQRQSLDDSSVVNFLTQNMGGGDYSQVMMQAGNPLELASYLLPYVRGLRMAAQAGRSTGQALRSVAGSLVANAGMEAVNMHVENPEATLAQYRAAGRDMVATALGMHALGYGHGKASQAADRAFDRMTEAVTSRMDEKTAAMRRATAQQKAYHEAERQGLVPPVREEGARYMVADSSGEQAFFTNREEAVEAAFAFMTPEQRQKAEALVGGALSAADAARQQTAQRHIQNVVGELNRRLPGLVHSNTHIFTSMDDLLHSDYVKRHPLTDDVIKGIGEQDGFFDTTTGATILIADKVKSRGNETPDQALRRAVLEHRVGYDGLSIVLGHISGHSTRKDLYSPAYEKWQKFSKDIPATERDALAAEPVYAHLKGDDEALNLVWFAREVAKDPMFAQRGRFAFVKEMWNHLGEQVAVLLEKAGLRSPALRDVKDQAFRQQVNEFIRLASNAVVVNRQGQTPRTVATSTTSGRTGRPIAPSLLPDGEMPDDTASRITSISKPHRPAPETYLRPEVIQKHLEQFTKNSPNGVVKVMKWKDYERFGPKHLDEKSYILPASKLPEILRYINGDRRRLEEALGYKPGALGNGDIGIVMIPSPEDLGLQIPTGNEKGANEFWIPGGKLPKTPAFDGMPEAVLDLKGLDKYQWPYQSLSLP